MSLKDNVEYVKSGISSEEKFLESFVRFEKFFKKYKIALISGAVIVVVAVIGINIKNSIASDNKIKANIAFNKVLANPADTTNLEELKATSLKLHDLALYLNAKDKNIEAKTNAKYLKDLTEYQEALKAQDINKLNSVSMKTDFLLKEFSHFNKALILAQNGKYEEAKNTLKIIKSDSQVNELVQLLNHFLLTK